MTARPYEAIATILNNYATPGGMMPQYRVVEEIAQAICAVLLADDPTFDRARFLAACGVGG